MLLYLAFKTFCCFHLFLNYLDLFSVNKKKLFDAICFLLLQPALVLGFTGFIGFLHYNDERRAVPKGIYIQIFFHWNDREFSTSFLLLQV